jgi:hypothetical protein
MYIGTNLTWINSELDQSSQDLYARLTNRKVNQFCLSLDLSVSDPKTDMSMTRNTWATVLRQNVA